MGMGGQIDSQNYGRGSHLCAQRLAAQHERHAECPHLQCQQGVDGLDAAAGPALLPGQDVYDPPLLLAAPYIHTGAAHVCNSVAITNQTVCTNQYYAKLVVTKMNLKL